MNIVKNAKVMNVVKIVAWGLIYYCCINSLWDRRTCVTSYIADSSVKSVFVRYSLTVGPMWYLNAVIAIIMTAVIGWYIVEKIRKFVKFVRIYAYTS